MTRLSLLPLIALAVAPSYCNAPAPPSPPVPSASVPGPSPSAPATPPAVISCPDPPQWGAALGKSISVAERMEREARINEAFTAAGYTHEMVLPGDCNDRSRIFYAELVAKIRARGDCAYDNDNGRMADAVHIVMPGGGKALDHHLLNFGGCRVRFASIENYAGTWALLGSAPPTTQPSSPATAPPGTVPPSSPSPGACPIAPLSAAYHIEMETHPDYSGQWADSTPLVAGAVGTVPPPPIMAADWSCYAKRCALAGEKSPKYGNACAAALCGEQPSYEVTGGNIRLGPTNGYAAKFNAADEGKPRAGTYRVCCPLALSACADGVIR